MRRRTGRFSPHPPTCPARRVSTVDERVAVLEARMTMLAEQIATLSALLREHMLREEATTQELRDSIAAVQRSLSGWRGVAAGAGLVVSAVWTAALALVAWLFSV